MSRNDVKDRVDAWFAGRGWTVFPFQRNVWKAALKGESGLLHANTGAGKTFAVWFAALQRAGLASGRNKAGFCGSRRCGRSRPIHNARSKTPPPS